MIQSLRPLMSRDWKACAIPTRVLVDSNDMIDNKGQIAALIAGGCTALISFEPFAAEVCTDPNIGTALTASMNYLRG